MLRNWRVWVLSVLFVGPLLVYVVLGFLWLVEHRGPFGFQGELVFYATLAWVGSYVLFSYLASRWTRSHASLLPPLNWESPGTFSEKDRHAWELVQQAAERGEELPLDSLSGMDVYIDTGRSLARELARHYRPTAQDPIEHVPIVDMLTALQLASEDLAQLLQEVPAGDLVTPAHWKRAVQAAGYLHRANEIYTFLLPMFQPAAGLMRLGAQKLMVQPAWKNIQQNLMRWFFRAYINRLGTHLIELYSGRLAMGANQYRRLSRRWTGSAVAGDRSASQLRIGIVGSQGSGKSTVRSAIESSRLAQLPQVKAWLREAGLDESLAGLLVEADLREIPGYTIRADGESARDRSTRSRSVRDAAETDLIVLVVDIARNDVTPEVRFLEDLKDRCAKRPTQSLPPAVVVLNGADRPDLPGGWTPPYDWAQGDRPREVWVRRKLEAFRAQFGELAADVVVVGLHPTAPFGVSERLLPEIATLLHRAERRSLLRNLDEFAGRSKIGRVVGQLGRHGRRLLSKGPRPLG